MAHIFKGRSGDLKWGRFDYRVTRTQKEALDGIWYMLTGQTNAADGTANAPTRGIFCSQVPLNGAMIIGLDHHSVTVYRSGRIISNAERG